MRVIWPNISLHLLIRAAFDSIEKKSHSSGLTGITTNSLSPLYTVQMYNSAHLSLIQMWLWLQKCVVECMWHTRYSSFKDFLAKILQVLAWQASIGSVDLSGTGDTRSVINDLFDYLEKSLGKEKVIRFQEKVLGPSGNLCSPHVNRSTKNKSNQPSSL